MANLDIEISRGADWSKVATVADNAGTPITVAASNFTGQIKLTSNLAATTPVASFSFALVTGGGADGKIRITLTKEQSLLLSRGKSYSYDIFATLLTRRYQLLWGSIILRDNVTDF